MTKKEILSKAVQMAMIDCEEYDKYCCCEGLCYDCPMLDENIRLEFYKMYGFCYQCAGQALLSGPHKSTKYCGFLVSETKKCNVCGGTGNFIQSIER